MNLLINTKVIMILKSMLRLLLCMLMLSKSEGHNVNDETGDSSLEGQGKNSISTLKPKLGNK